MLIGFSGPSGSGKTTIVNELAEYLRKKDYDVGVVNEVARDVFQKYSKEYGFKSLSELRKSDRLLQFQYDVLREQIFREEELMENHSIVLTDRTIHDNLFYTIPSVYECDYTLLHDYLETFSSANPDDRYDFIFFCEPVDGDVDDGFRTPDIEYREFQRYVMWRLLPAKMKLERRVFVLLPDPVDVRVEKCWMALVFYDLL